MSERETPQQCLKIGLRINPPGMLESEHDITSFDYLVTILLAIFTPSQQKP